MENNEKKKARAQNQFERTIILQFNGSMELYCKLYSSFIVS